MKYLRYLLILLVVLITVYSYLATRVPSGPPVSVEPNLDYKETTYSIVDQNKRMISLTTYQTELNKSVLRLRSRSGLPLSHQIKLLDKILDKVLKDDKDKALQTLFIGRLVNAFGQDRTLSDRLARAAAQSPLWDLKRGGPVAGHENQAVKRIANQAGIYPELKELFKKHGLAIEVSGVEKVLVSRADRAPYDCLTWFSLKEL